MTTRIELVDPDPVVGAGELLTPECLDFVARLHDRFAGRRDELLSRRSRRRAEAAQRGRLDFLPETADIRSGTWSVADAPPGLQDRRVEITGPATPANMAINALNSGARVWLADLEDAGHPSWPTVVDGLVNLRHAAAGTLAFTSAAGKSYSLTSARPLATVVMRPRGWHLPEAQVRVAGAPAVGALVDFGLHAFHLATDLLATGQGPYYYLPKIESHLEARLWNDIFTYTEGELEIPYGSIRATALIETIPAAFEMEEILYELKDHAGGLNAGRWDYLFSIIKYFRDAGDRFVLADRGAITMTAPFMRAYTELLVRTCHKRGAMAIGGMSAFIPSRRDKVVNRVALEQVRADKVREATDGFDGSWVAHPDLVPLCDEVFSARLGSRPNQLDRLREDVVVTADELLAVTPPPGANTETGLRNNVRVALIYLAEWLSGTGAVAIDNKMEDVATAEISRSQIWQLVQNHTMLADTGHPVTAELVSRLIAEETRELAEHVPADRFERYYVPARRMVTDLCLDQEFVDFLTLPAYERIS